MKLLILEEIAELMHWSPGTARNRISNYEPMPPYIQVGHRLLFPEDDFNEWVKKNLITGENTTTKHEGSKRFKTRVVTRIHK